MIELGERGLNIAAYKRGTRRVGFLGLGGSEDVLVPDNHMEARSMLIVKYSEQVDFSVSSDVKYEPFGVGEFHGPKGQIDALVKACEARDIRQTGTI